MFSFSKTVILCLVGFSLIGNTRTANADVDVTNYPLGISPRTLHDKLVADRFVFLEFSNKKIIAVKKVVTDVSQGQDFPDLTQSTTLTVSVCAGKVFKIMMNSVYGGDRDALLMGRKSFYKYLKDNSAVNDKILLHKNEANPQVVLWFSIDRNNQANKEVRGTEIIKLALSHSSNVTSGKPPKPLLEMNYYIENKWFCPN